MNKTQYNYFIRFGDIPDNEMSKNFLTNENELGVSVYDCVIHNDKIGLVFPNLTYSSCVTLSGVLDRPCYLVEGDKIGIGSDGEPLIKNIKIIKDITSRIGF